MKCMQKLYSGYHLKIECKHVVRGKFESKLSRLGYRDFVNDNGKDKDDDNTDDRLEKRHYKRLKG